MQIVIDIPDKTYDYITKYQNVGGWVANTVTNAILGGTPLPKGHGKLIDADEIQFENTEFDTYGDYSRAFDAIDQADTIIEADKEKE